MNKHLRLLVTTFTLLASVAFSYAQTATIRGFVYDKESGEPIIFTNVYLKGTSTGAATDVNGYFSITKVPAGQFQLAVSAMGYEEYVESISLFDKQILNTKVYITQAAFEMDEVRVSAKRKEATNQVQMSVTKLTPKQIKKMPSIGGEPDLAQYIQVLPGVVFTGDQGGQLYIRGGSPVQNKVLLDGMIIFNPFHSIGLFSVFDTDVMRNADVYTGGFSAEYGGRISSIMDITTIDGNKKKFGGKIGATPFGAKVMVQGPLKPMVDGEDGSITYILSAKTSYLDRTSKVLYKYVNEDGLPFNYTDLYGKVTFASQTGSKASIFGFNFTDQVKYQLVSDLSWSNTGGGANFLVALPGNPVLIEGTIAQSSYNIKLKEDGLSNRESGISNFNVGFNFKYFNGDDEIKYGINANFMKTSFNYFNTNGQPFETADNSSEIAGFFVYKLKANNLVLEPSVRVQYYTSLAEISLEPRIGAKYNVTKSFRLKAAGGKYTQNLLAGNSDRDVVNLFYGFISSPEGVANSYIDESGEEVERESTLQIARHAITGFEVDVTDRISLNVEVYKKWFDQLTNINRTKYFDDAATEQPEELRKSFLIETGTARGIDIVWKYTTSRFYFWAVYSLGKVERWDGKQNYAPIFDRRHSVNLVTTYNFGKDRSWEVSGRWNLGSGLPFTPTRGNFEDIQLDLTTDVSTKNGQLGTLYGDLNTKRLPYYHRLDINISKKVTMKNKSVLEANLGVTNAYSRENIFYFDRVTNEQVNQLPILPNFGVNYTF